MKSAIPAEAAKTHRQEGIGMLSSVQAVILAGGLGTRLRGAVADRNKVAAEINGRPFLQYLLDRLSGCGFRQAVICSGYLHDDLHRRLGNQHQGITLRYSKEERPLGTAGALRHAGPHLVSDAVVVLNGDSYCDLDYEQMVEQHLRRLASATLAAVHVEDTGRYGRLMVDDAGKVVAFKEKASPAGPGHINAGIYVLQRSLIDTIPSGGPLSLERDVFPQWAAREAIDVYYHTGRFIDIGTVSDYTAAPAYLAAGSGMEVIS